VPNIRGIELTDGVKILSGEKNTPDAQYSAAQFQAYLASHTIAQTETTVNNFLNNLLPAERVMVHIFSTSPLKVTCIVANRWNMDGTPVVIPDNWWGG